MIRPGTVVPDRLDWYNEGKVSESVDQGGCGACWAFVTATTLESLNAIENNLTEVPKYSVQYLMDCDDVNWACDGGWMYDAYLFTAQYGVLDWDDYPTGYVGYKQHSCKDKSTEMHSTRHLQNRFYNTYQYEEDYVTNERIREVVSRQPIGVAMYSNFDCLDAYISGIMTERDCQCSDGNTQEVNHAVTIIGYGTSKRYGCSEYWIIHNSWGADWGENGNFKLCADRKGKTAEFGTCQVNSYIMWPTLDKIWFE